MAKDPKEASKLKLYSFWFSSCSHRIRIALNLKGLEYEYHAVNLAKNEQSDPEYEKLNPVKFVPTLVDGNVVVADSFAIALYLEDRYPEHPLLPKDLQKKALNLQVASIVGSSIQPLQMVSLLDYMGDKFKSDDKLAWSRHHVARGITVLEKLLKGSTGKYATGDEPLLADVFLAPQLYVAINRLQMDMTPYPTLARINAAYAALPAFEAALPLRQPDAPSS